MVEKNNNRFKVVASDFKCVRQGCIITWPAEVFWEARGHKSEKTAYHKYCLNKEKEARDAIMAGRYNDACKTGG